MYVSCTVTVSVLFVLLTTVKFYFFLITLILAVAKHVARKVYLPHGLYVLLLFFLVYFKGKVETN